MTKVKKTELKRHVTRANHNWLLVLDFGIGHVVEKINAPYPKTQNSNFLVMP